MPASAMPHESKVSFAWAAMAVAALAMLPIVPAVAVAVAGAADSAGSASGAAPPLQVAGKLPAVPITMGASFKAFGGLALNLASDAARLEGEVRSLQQDATERMARHKAELEEKLRVQEGENQALAGKVESLTIELGKRRADNESLRRKARQLQEGNKRILANLRKAQSRMDVAAQEFAAAASTQGGNPAATSDSAAAEGEGQSEAEEGDEEGAVPSFPPQAAAASTDGGNPAAASGSAVAEGEGQAEAEEGEEGLSFLATASSTSLDGGVAAKEAPQAAAPSSLASPLFTSLRGLERGVSRLFRLEQQTEAGFESAFRKVSEAAGRRRAELRARLDALRREQRRLDSAHSRLEAMVGRLQSEKLLEQTQIQAVQTRLKQRLGKVAQSLRLIQSISAE